MVTGGFLLVSMLPGAFPLSTQARSVRRSANTRAKPLAAAPEHLRITRNRAPLSASKFYQLPLTAIKPRGWLRRQLQVQADGLTGYLDEFWSDLSPNSAWLGGSGEGWERGPYYTDGLVPLAYLLDDPKLKAKADRWVGWTLQNQRSDGSIGPEKNKDWWPNMIMLKALAQYYEATGDGRVLPLMQRYFRYHLQQSRERPLFEWAKYRWGEEVWSVLWLYNRTGDKSLLDLAQALHRQGFDWKQHFADFKYPAKVTREQIGLVNNVGNTDRAMSTHGVNNAMAMKYEALWSLVSRDESDRHSVYQMLDRLDKYHLLPNGMHSADEHYAGANPSQGVELCDVVETMFSLENLIGILGDARLGDRLERIAFNALPGTFTGDMWAHQYDQQPNQIACDIKPRNWTTNGNEANVFGLEPHFGCCTANMHQGFPKLAASLWMATAEGGGLAAVAYAPSEVNTFVKNSVPVSVIETTEYPFRQTISFTINPAHTVAFPLQLRIPTWATDASLTVNGVKQPGVKAGAFHTIARQWKRGDQVTLTLPLHVRTSTWLNNSVAVERGPLVFSLRLGEEFRRINQGMSKPAPPPAADWEIEPTSAWNYGLLIPAANFEQAVRVIEKPVGDLPFTAAGAPVEIRLKARRVPQWSLDNNSAAPPPPSPVSTREPLETVTLIPYGAAKLRITAFPQIVGSAQRLKP